VTSSSRFAPHSSSAHSSRNYIAIAAVALLAFLAGCHRHRKTTSAPNSTDYADNIQAVVAKKDLPGLRWPDYSDYQPAVTTFYDDRNNEIAWTRDLKPTTATQGFLKAFSDAGAKGLNPEDYDASRWPDRLQQIARIAATKDTSGAAQDTVAQFDTYMTVCVMRYISDLRIGRVNPQHFNFDIDVASKKYDLAEFVSDNAVDATDIPKLIASVEPDSDQYRATEAALAHYLTLAQVQAAAAEQPLPDVAKPGLSPGSPYPAAGELLARLQLEGDAPGEFPYTPPAPPAPAAPQPAPAKPENPAQRLGDEGHKLANQTRQLLHRPGKSAKSAMTQRPAPIPAFHPTSLPPVYTADLAAAVKNYQHRHGLTEDGRLTPETVKNLNVPLTARVVQLQDSLERWRWLPAQYINAPLMVNLPEFLLRGYDKDHKLDFTMKVVVGKVVGDHDTPVFAHMMRYLIFRPYWNVPVDIARKEIAPHLATNPNYLAQKNFEATDSKGNILSGVTAKQVAGGQVLVREEPGPKNSLGLVKFMFPNQYDIYLHSTPAPELFERTRRDFSHGCVRVQKPEDLAVWVLNTSGTPGPVSGDPAGAWDIPHVHEAMTAGPDNHQINLKNPIPIVIFYVTAIAAEDGHTHFFDDLYGYDQKLQQVLAKGPPYPTQPDPSIPTPKPGDTM
jgi:murein L,D-transpeptidase YcbB/YkuD